MEICARHLDYFQPGLRSKILFGRWQAFFWVLGGNLNYDRQGDSKLTLTGINVGASYPKINKTTSLEEVPLAFQPVPSIPPISPGIKQWDGVSFNPNAPSGENFNFQRVNMLETALGVNYRYQQSSRTFVDASIGAYHLHQPSTTFYNTLLKVYPSTWL